MFIITTSVAFALLFIACAESSPDEMPRCGDGIVTHEPIAESCDDGEANGTSGSVCRRDCTSAASVWKAVPEDTTTLPFPAKKLVASETGLIMSNYDEGGVAIVPKRNALATTILRGSGVPRSFTVTGSPEIDGAVVIWIERDGGPAGNQQLWWANLAETPPIPRQMDYPITSAMGGLFILNQNYTQDGFADVDANRRLYQVQVASFSPPQLQVWDVGSAPDGTLVAAIVVADDVTSAIAYFFDDGVGTQVALATHPQNGPPRIYRTVRVPTRVVDVTRGYFERSGGVDRLAILSPQGEIHTWDFTRPDPEAFLCEFGRVRAGTQHLYAYTSVVAVTPLGEVAHLVENGSGQSLASQYHVIAPPCSVCTIAETTGPTAEWFAFDTVAIHGWPVPEEPPRPPHETLP